MVGEEVILSQPHLWWDGSAHGSIAERAIHKQAMPAEGGQYEPKQAAIQCSLTSMSVAAVVTQMAHMYTLWRLGRSSLKSCRQQSVCV